LSGLPSAQIRPPRRVNTQVNELHAVQSSEGVPQVGSAAKAEHQGRRRKRHIYEKDADDKPVRQIASGQLSAVPNDKWDENLHAL
jgi:hypothetical protein